MQSFAWACGYVLVASLIGFSFRALTQGYNGYAAYLWGSGLVDVLAALLQCTDTFTVMIIFVFSRARLF